MPKSGIPYLSPEGYPYRIFDKANADVVRNAARLSVKQAMLALIEAHLEVAVVVTPRKLSSMFRLLISELELESITSPHIEKSGKLWIWSADA